jgi:hypothetical protein
MGTPYQSTPHGTPPVCTSLAHREWCESLLDFRLAECPSAKTTTYYFAQAGNDTTGDGTEATPWRTLVKANEIIAALSSNADTAIRFKRGDKWSESATLTANKSNITIGAYGTGAKPIFTRFVAIPRGSWTVTAGRTDVWQYSLATAVSAVRMLDDTTVGFVQCQNLDDVEANNGSWWWDTGTNRLYMRPYKNNATSATVAPTTDAFYYEYCPSNATRGITATGDIIRIEDIRVDGPGCQANPNNDANYAIYWTPSTPTDACVITNCEAYYSEAHNIGTTTTESGGIFTVHSCRMGWMSSTNSTGGIGQQAGTLAVSYAGLGGNEAIFWGNRYCSGQLYGRGVDYENVLSGLPGYAHTSGGANRMSLGLAMNEYVEPSMNQCASISAFGNAPTFSDIADCRAWVINSKVEARGRIPQDDGKGFVVAVRYPLPTVGDHTYAWINCDIMSRATADTVATNTRSLMLSTTIAGIMINCKVVIDWIGSMPNGAGAQRWINTSAASSTRIYNSLIQIKTYGPSGAQLSNRFDNSLIVLKNSIFSVDGKSGMKNRAVTGIANNASFINNNAYFIDSDLGNTGQSNDPHAVSFPGDSFELFPSAATPLLSANQQLVEGRVLEFDFYYNPRIVAATARGPIEATDGEAVRFINLGNTNILSRESGQTLLPSVGETIGQSITLYQQDKTTPVSLAGKDLSIVFETLRGIDVAVVPTGSILISGDDYNVITFTYPAAVTLRERTLKFAIRDASAPLTMYLQGLCVVTRAPQVDV